MPRLQLQAQHGRRRFTGAARRAQQKAARVSAGGGELQAPYRLAVRVHAPAQYGGGRIAVQRLFGGPQRLHFRLLVLASATATFDKQ